MVLEKVKIKGIPNREYVYRGIWIIAVIDHSSRIVHPAHGYCGTNDYLPRKVARDLNYAFDFKR
jgi:hypothetical protein